TIDTAAPTAPSTPDLTAASDSGSSNTDNITSNTTPACSGTAEACSTVRIYSDGTQAGSGTATSGSYAITTTVLAPGTHSITAMETGRASSSEPISGALSATIDTGDNAPSAQDLTAASDTGSTNSANLTSN